MDHLVRLFLVAAAVVVPKVGAQGFDPELVGTWTTSARTVFTGPGFYNPVADQLSEPNLPGISYSFTQDGWYEEAYYRALANPTTPNCPSGVLQWQHGNYAKHSNGSLTLTPIAVDGRMLQSNPCSSSSSIFTRYSQWEMFKWYEISNDAFHGVKRLDLYQFDGSPMNPMYLAYSPTPQMLPTQTLNPTAAPSASSTTTSRRKRDLPTSIRQPSSSRWLDPDWMWWLGIGTTALGAVAYIAF